MNAKQALAQARKRWGKTAAVEDRPQSATTPEQRAEAQKELDEHRREWPEASKRPKELRDRMQKLASTTWRRRYQVGTVESMAGLAAFFIKGTGDTWEEALADADKRYPAKKAA